MAWVIPAHAAVASVALMLGAYNLLRPTKGDRQHRLIGRVWVVAMYATILSSFTIREIRPGQFSWIHGLSVFTFVTLTIALWAAFTHRVQTHRRFVTGSYLGLVGAFVGAVAVPVRYLPRTAVERPVEFALALLGCVVAAIAVIQLTKQQPRTRSRVTN
ncbi:DUF2306 domain-containing protein [Allorhizocola rhizosphaerae]|uniref:DUF2306 domain-containing protein n=1 Tax=Allorhizocola rhizosphaerae TaxID=1872709 RepID=UPI0013C2F02A|nr:DUF2306 domain-containing protein [Allorhizocola rhizosphaerae]